MISPSHLSAFSDVAASRSPPPLRGALTDQINCRVRSCNITPLPPTSDIHHAFDPATGLGNNDIDVGLNIHEHEGKSRGS